MIVFLLVLAGTMPQPWQVKASDIRWSVDTKTGPKPKDIQSGQHIFEGKNCIWTPRRISLAGDPKDGVFKKDLWIRLCYVN